MAGLSIGRTGPRLLSGVRGFHTSSVRQITLSERIFGTTSIFKQDLIKPFVGSPEPNYVASEDPTKPRITRIENGVRVVTQDFGRPMSAVAAFVDISPRYETFETAGSSYMLEKLAFKGSSKRPPVQVIRDIENLPASFTATASREMLASCAEGLRYKSKDILTALIESSVLSRPMADVSDYETKEYIQQELTAMKALLQDGVKEQAENTQLVILDALHDAAYNGRTLGHPTIVTDSMLKKITPDSLHSFMMELLTGENIVISGCDVDHDEMVAVVAEMLGHLPQGTSNRSRLPAKYTGGEVRIRSEDQARIAIGFEGYCWADKEIVAQFVLSHLMGGGDYFSTGGPGKGLLTRLYTDVLNRHHWVNSAITSNLLYADSSVFAIQLSSFTNKMEDLMATAISAAQSLEKAPTPVELERAKRQAIGNMLANTDGRLVTCEDLGRQVSIYDKYTTPDEFVTRIEKLTAADLKSVGEKLLSSTPSVALMGDLQTAPEQGQFKSMLTGGTRSIKA
uniref:Mitochondrial-processing peptidase subunit alpha n=1 Tax=Rhodosorus marinus TaxID=101924 RepID=A0A6T6L4W7_9RHOD|mmetsp:Transcript_17559/g.25248  ORF Transcript_17559/g.25248 Transcript_17559/m.25248 type:complete len:511 (+) Transcript_17559:46-1578(+)